MTNDGVRRREAKPTQDLAKSTDERSWASRQIRISGVEDEPEASRAIAAGAQARRISWQRGAQLLATSESALRDGVLTGEYPATAPESECPFTVQDLSDIVAMRQRRCEFEDNHPASSAVTFVVTKGN
jgi:hypothetical protein